MRTALRTPRTSTRKAGGDGGDSGGGDGSGDGDGGGGEAGERGGRVRNVRDEEGVGHGGFGTLLTLRSRPFLSELWPG